MKFCYWISIAVLLTSCSTAVIKDSGPSGTIDTSDIPDAIPTNEAPSKGGNPKSYVVFGKRYYVLESAKGFTEKGIASWYGNKFHGKKTSNGETYDMYAMTAAHKRLPLPTYVMVTNTNNKRSVVVRVNDRGPFHEGRIIDLSYVAAHKLGIDTAGTAPVEIKVITRSSALGTSTTGDSTLETPESDPQNQRLVSIQIGAYSVKSSAEKLKNEISKLITTSVSISDVIKDGKKLYRVRLGPFKQVTLAEKWLRKLEQLSFNQARLVYID
jgi:rare lipoprotein A